MRGILIMLLLTSLFACQKVKLNKTEQVLKENVWKIENFTINSQDVMHQGYGEYTITFVEEGSVIHAKIPSLQTDVLGSWQLLPEESKASISIKMENPLGQLTEVWKIESVSKRRIVLTTDDKKELTLMVNN